MQKQVSDLAVTYTKLSAQEATIAAQKKVQLAEADRDAAAQLIKAKADAQRSIIAANATNETTKNRVRTDNEVLLETTRAKSEASQVEADTEARNKLAIAAADAQTIVQIGEAEVKILRLKNELPNAQLRIVTDAQKEVLHGVQKVIYTTNQSMLMNPYMRLAESDGFSIDNTSGSKRA
jgi:hypothetical protein